MAHTIDIHCGHGKTTDGKWDAGCTYGKHTEAGLMLPITKSAVKYLRASGFKVYSDSDTDNNRNMISDVAWSNSHKSEIYISIHCDYSGAPSGVYPLYTSTKGKKLADVLNTTIKSEMKMKSRGLGKRCDLYELNATDAVAVVLEVGGIKSDLAILRDKPDAYGKAIAKAVCKYFGVTFKESATNSTTTTPTTNTANVSRGKTVNYKVKVSSALNIRKGASSTLPLVGKCPAGTYTIVEELGAWGFLKSGKGWIYLPYTKKVTTSKATNKISVASGSANAKKMLTVYAKLGKDTIANGFTYSNVGSKTTYESALKTNKRTNCAREVSWVMQRCGLLAKGKVIYYKNGLKGSGASAVLKSPKLKIIRPNKATKHYKLIPGDIVCYSNHMQVFTGYKSSHPYWMSFGGSDVKAFRAKKKFFLRRKSSYDNKTICMIIRAR